MLLISTEKVPRAEQHSHAHSLLSRALREYGIVYVMGTTPVVCGEHGKPSLAERSDVHYNISHADGIAAVAVSGCECGVDCERVREFDPRIMKRVCRDTERAMLEAAPENERGLLFFRLWTLKEAYVKALGCGLSFPLRNAAFEFEDGRIRTELSGCTFAQYTIGSEFVVSVCELSKARGSHKIYCPDMREKNFLII